MDASSILSEAYSLVDAGLISGDNFKDLTYRNPMNLHLKMNPGYFKGTVVESAADELLAAGDLVVGR